MLAEKDKMLIFSLSASLLNVWLVARCLFPLARRSEEVGGLIVRVLMEQLVPWVYVHHVDQPPPC